MQFFVQHQTMIIFFAFLISEALGAIPSVKANGLFQLFAGWIKKAKEAEAEKSVAQAVEKKV